MNVPQSKKEWFGLLLLAGLLMVLCGTTSYFTVKWAAASRPHPENYAEGHHWLHRELNLTRAEKDAVNAFEGPYREQRQQLLEEFNRRISALADLLQAEDEVTPGLEHAIHRLHEVHGQLQELSIAHYFDMLRVLPPEKRIQLRALAGQALSEPE